jgi:hypothetical protein
VVGVRFTVCFSRFPLLLCSGFPVYCHLELSSRRVALTQSIHLFHLRHLAMYGARLTGSQRRALANGEPYNWGGGKSMGKGNGHGKGKDKGKGKDSVGKGLFQWPDVKGAGGKDKGKDGGGKGFFQSTDQEGTGGSYKGKGKGSEGKGNFTPGDANICKYLFLDLCFSVFLFFCSSCLLF